MTAAHARVERVVKENFVNEKPTTKAAVLYALKKAVPALKLRPTTWRLLSVLCDMSQAIDWEDRKIGPVVWPSNAALAERVGVDVRSVQFHLRRLVDIGLITYSDSATRKRYGTRVNGRIVQACGINLSPLLIRREQFLEMAASHQAELVERKRLSQAISDARIRVTRLVAGGRDLAIDGPWDQISDALARLAAEHGTALTRPTRTVRASISQLQSICSALISLEARAQSAWDAHTIASSSDAFPSPTGDKRFTQNPITEIQIKRDSLNQEATGTAPGKVYEPNHSNPALGQMPSQASISIPSEGSHQRDLDIQIIKKGCPALALYYPDAFASTQKLAVAIHYLPAMLGISGKLWDSAQKSLGRLEASLSLLVILQGHEDGRISNPGGYLNALVQKPSSSRSSMANIIFSMATKQGQQKCRPGATGYGAEKMAERHAG